MFLRSPIAKSRRCPCQTLIRSHWYQKIDKYVTITRRGYSGAIVIVSLNTVMTWVLQHDATGAHLSLWNRDRELIRPRVRRHTERNKLNTAICNYAFLWVQILWALFLLDTFKIKPICWKQTITMETSILKASHDSSSFDQRDYVVWHRHCCSIPIFWILYSIFIGFSEGSDQRKLQGVILPILSAWRNWIIQGLWVQPKLEADITNVAEVPQ